ncbi:hypothetical protein ACV35N_36950, partial [Pseudomonas aeruginosa]
MSENLTGKRELLRTVTGVSPEQDLGQQLFTKFTLLVSQLFLQILRAKGFERLELPAGRSRVLS